MKFFLLVYILSFFITVCRACTLRTATVRINNNSSKKILSATLSHRYSNVYRNQQSFVNILNGQISQKFLTVEYHTGFLCTGQDWWHITWLAEDGTTYVSDPNNGQCWLNYVAMAASRITSSVSIGRLPVSLARMAVKATVTAARFASQNDQSSNPDDFCDHKGCTLNSDDINSAFNINLYSSTNEGFQIAPPSGACSTNYRELRLCPGFVQLAGLDLPYNDIIDPSNPPKAPNKEACCTQCYLNIECQAYTWNSVNENCYLKSASSGRGVVTSIAFSGVRQVDAKYFAVQNGWDIRSNDISKFTVYSYSECAMKCDEDSACVSFTLVLNTDMCYLFADVGSGGVPYSVSLAGYKGEYSAHFLRRSGWDFPGSDIMTGTSPQVSSYQACASLCYWHNQCDAFTWNSFNLNCFLKSAVAFSTGSQHASGESGVRGVAILRPAVDFYTTGETHIFQYCPRGSWVYGFQQRVEPPQGSGDDTALNAIRLYCKTKTGTFTTTISSYDGIWGNWGDTAYCPGNNQFMVSACFKIENPSANDGTLANAMKSKCYDYNSGVVGTEYIQADNDGPWGSFRSEETCPSGTAICGISSRFTPPRQSGLNRDDVAMNGAEFMCCAIFDCLLEAQSTLDSGMTLSEGCSIKSENGAYYAIMQIDGNFAIYRTNPSSILWTSQTMGQGQRPYRLVLQFDGNLVLYDGNNAPKWASNTPHAENNPRSLVMQDDGNMVIYDGNGVTVWASNTAQ